MNHATQYLVLLFISIMGAARAIQLDQLKTSINRLQTKLSSLSTRLQSLDGQQELGKKQWTTLDTFEKIKAKIKSEFKRDIALQMLEKGDLQFTAHNLPSGAKLTDSHMQTLIPILEQLDKLIRLNKLLSWLKRFKFVAEEINVSDVIKEYGSDKYSNQLNINPSEIIKFAKNTYKIHEKEWKRESDTAETNLQNDMRRAGIYNISFHGNSLETDPTKELKEKLFHNYLQFDFYGNPFNK
jgi:hypothetical protein